MGRMDIADIDIIRVSIYIKHVSIYIKNDIIKRIRYFFIPKKVFVNL